MRPRCRSSGEAAVTARPTMQSLKQGLAAAGAPTSGAWSLLAIAVAASWQRCTSHRVPSATIPSVLLSSSTLLTIRGAWQQQQHGQATNSSSSSSQPTNSSKQQCEHVALCVLKLACTQHASAWCGTTEDGITCCACCCCRATPESERYPSATKALRAAGRPFGMAGAPGSAACAGSLARMHTQSLRAAACAHAC